MQANLLRRPLPNFDELDDSSSESESEETENDDNT
jgi:hypothetical protein